MLCTLLINAPLLPRVLRLTKLDVVPDARLALRRRALRALDAHTASAVASLRAEEDAMMAGVDWARVRELTKVGGAGDFASFAEQAGGARREGDERARKRREHLKKLGASEMRHGMTDAWEGLAGFFRRLFGRRGGGGGSGRRDGVSVGAASSSHHRSGFDPRRQKSTSSMATIFLDDAGAVSKHHRVFGRTISLNHSGGASAGSSVAAAAAGVESPLASSSSPVASLAAAVAAEAAGRAAASSPRRRR